MSTTNQLPTYRALPQPSHPVNLGRHQRRCTVCNHSDRAHIEQDFIDWRNPWDIAEDYEIRDRSSIYRHAHATGLYSLRRSNYRAALENLIERNEEVQLTADSIIRAVRACAHINDDGKWVEHPHRVIVTDINASSDVSSSPAPVRMGEEPYLTSYAAPEIPVAASRAKSQLGHKLKRSQLVENKEPDLFQIATKIELLEKLLK